MKIVIAICVYDRLENIKTWLNCWAQCEQHEAELVVIHNFYGNEVEKEKFKSLCDKAGIKYIPRNSQGYDIGSFQDVCRNRLPGFPDYDLLLWCADDTLPMSKDFLSPYLNKLTEKVGVCCMDLSPYVRPHIRTSGFMLRKEIANRLQFEVDPITTKEDCYRFEHRDPVNWFYQQIIRMGLTVVQVEKRETSPLWDMGYKKGLKRMNEHLSVFSIKSKVTFICPIYQMYPQIISSLICQTHKDWELLLIHNGPLNGFEYDIPKDERVKFIVYPEATGKWGHPLRQWALNEIKEGRMAKDSEYIVVTNADNYHSPTYTEYMLRGFVGSGAYATYCSDMVHSYKAWQVIPCRLQRGYVDCAGVMVKKEIAADTGWRDVDSHSSDWTYFQDIIAKYGADKWVKVTGCLLVHNVIIFIMFICYATY